MSESLPEHLRTAAVAALSGVPLVGGPLSVLMEKYLPSYVEKRRMEFIDGLARSFNLVQGKIELSVLESDEFISVFVKCAKLYVEEGSREKRLALRAIVLNAALRRGAEFDEVTLFLRLISGLTEDQIRILGELSAGKAATEKYKDLTDALKAEWPQVDGDYLMACVADLMNFNLIRSNWSSEEAKASKHALTPLGERFVAFISNPCIAEEAEGASKPPSGSHPRPDSKEEGR